MLSLEAIKVASLRFLVEFKVATQKEYLANVHNLFVNTCGNF